MVKQDRYLIQRTGGDVIDEIDYATFVAARALRTSGNDWNFWVGDVEYWAVGS